MYQIIVFESTDDIYGMKATYTSSFSLGQFKYPMTKFPCQETTETETKYQGKK